jgi:hypothetical protein
MDLLSVYDLVVIISFGALILLMIQHHGDK